MESPTLSIVTSCAAMEMIAWDLLSRVITGQLTLSWRMKGLSWSLHSETGLTLTVF